MGLSENMLNGSVFISTMFTVCLNVVTVCFVMLCSFILYGHVQVRKL